MTIPQVFVTVAKVTVVFSPLFFFQQQETKSNLQNSATSSKRVAEMIMVEESYAFASQIAHQHPPTTSVVIE